MRRSNYPLRLQRSLLEEAREAAESEGVSLNQLFNVAVAEKLSAVRTAKYFREPIHRADRPDAPPTLDQAAKMNSPMESDESPMGGQEGFGKESEPEVQPAPPPDWVLYGERAGAIDKPAGRATPQFGMLKKRLEKFRRG
jgi:hypothetical protein